MSAEDIEASKAPLMDHLIELRSRLIKALLAFGIAFIFCFFFAKQIFNVLVWPYVLAVGSAGSAKLIYTAFLEYFLTHLQRAVSAGAREERCNPLWRRRVRHRSHENQRS